MVTLSFACALILSVLASVLKIPQEVAKELDRSQQLLIASKIFSHDGYFLMKNKEGEYIPAKYAEDGVLVPTGKDDLAADKEILDVYRRRVRPYLVDEKGNLTTFEEAGINQEQYLAEFKETGYFTQPLKLIYEVLPNPKKGESEEEEVPIAYVIPVNGYGLWGPIYGYIAIAPDGDTVIGISWYEHGETPGLGANIADEPWQKQFYQKKIFLPTSAGETNLKTAPIGITVVKGKVSEVLGTSLKTETAVDGMPGATLTGNGVTTAYQEVLDAYRPFFIKLNEKAKQQE